MEVKNIISNLQELENSLPEMIQDSIKELEREILEMNTKQLFDGIDSEGQFLQPPYKPKTIARKKKKGQPFNRVTLKDEGDFYSSFELVFLEPDCFKLVATQPTAEYLLKRYGEAIEGLTNENVNILTEKIEKTFLTNFKNQFNASF